MKFMARFLALIALLALVASAPVFAQSAQQQKPGMTPTQQQQPPKQPGTPAKPGQQAAPSPDQPPAPPLNPEEEAAYKAFLDSKDQTLATKLGEEFIQKYPLSKYREYTYTRLAQAYLNLQQLDKLFVAGEKALEINPDNMDVLTLMCWATARSTRADALDAQQKFDKAEKYGRRAVELLGAIQKPEHLAEEDFKRLRNEGLAMAHSGLGVVQFRRQQLAEAAKEFEQATALSVNPDPTDLYLYGIVLKATKRFAEAADAYGRCAAIPGPFQERCKSEQADAQKAAGTQLQPPAPPKP